MAARKLYLCLFGCLWSYAVAQPPAILTGPVRQLVPFNLDAMATFNCTVRGQQLIWQVNSAQLVTPMDITDAQSIGIFPETTDNGNGTIFGTLRIDVSESNVAVNMTQIGCLAVGDSTLDRDVSDFVSLTTFDIPEAPRNFRLTLSNTPNTLTIRWDPPTNTPPDVPTTHDVEVVNMATRDPYPGFPQTDLELDMTELSFDEQDISCTPFDFLVVARNEAGTSGPSMMTETIPISPDVTPINEDLPDGVLVSFSGSDVFITLTFRRAQTCNVTSFPVMEHIINIEIAETPSSFPTPDLNDVVVFTLGPANLVMDTVYTMSVTASSGIIRRTSDAFQVYTTDVQPRRPVVEYIELDNRVYLVCIFADGSEAQGCIITFTLRNETERFYVTREGGEGTQCNTTVNSAGSYDIVQVVDWERDGSEGVLPRTIQPELIPDERSFSRFCPLPDSGLSGGEIAGVVIGIVAAVLLVAAIVVVVIVLYFTTRSNTEYGEDDDKKRFWINLPGIHMSSVVRPGMHEEPDSEDEAERGESTPLTGGPPPSDTIHGGEPFEESNVRLLAAHSKLEPTSDIPMGTMTEGGATSEERRPVRVDSVSADMGTTVSPSSPPPSFLPTTATIEPSHSVVPMGTLRSIDSGAGTSTKPRQVGELDLSNSKSMKIRLNPSIVRKALKRRSANQDDTKKLLLYAQ